MIKETITANFQQLKDILYQLSDEQLSRKLPVLNYSTIGMHIRHIIEFYCCLMESRTTGRVDYDSRKRDIELETRSRKCIAVLDDILDFIATNSQDFPINLKADYSLKKEDPIILSTTFYRELLYNIEHTVHHMAIIKIGIGELNDAAIRIDENFGVAVSTIRNKTICAQ
ncbi:MAG: hypothetical protein KDD04_02550 [Sinomicrobium sp.]|nr:hypothetical protein [Sinomicrobium sp.]